MEKKIPFIIDVWGNFERFEMDPNPKDTSSTLPIAIRYFRNLIKLVRKIHNKEDFVYKFCFKEIRSIISLLPEDSPSVMEYYSTLEKIKDNIFWETIDKEKLEYLNFNIAPIINLIKENKLHQWLCRNLIIEYLLSQYSNNLDDMKNKSEKIKNEIKLLPSDHPIVSDHLKDTISKTINTDFENSIDEKIFDYLIELSEIMHLKRTEERAFIRLNLEDFYQDRDWIIFGPKNEKILINEYKEKIIKYIKSISPEKINLEVKYIQDNDANEIFIESELDITENNLRKAFKYPFGNLKDIIEHITENKELLTKEEMIEVEFKNIIDENNLNDKQVQYIELIKKQLIRNENSPSIRLTTSHLLI